jgi:multidrug efflux pump subunit AcrB
MLNFNLASFARPYFGALVLTTGLLTAGGVYSYTQMPSSVYPEVTFPRIAVVARVPDKDVVDMEVKVTRPLEEAVSTVIGVAQVRSKTIRGSTEISMDFSPGVDMRRAEVLTWNRIGAKRSDLPPNCDLTVEQMTPSVFPIMSLVLTSTDANKSELRDYAFYQLAPQIKGIPDVLYANVAGGDLREIEVVARPDDLVSHGISAADLADQIRQRTRRTSIGRIEGDPLAYQIIVDNQPESVRQIKDMVIGKSLRVSDVADVRIGHQDRVMSIGFNREDAVVITIFRRLGGNTVNISKAVRELLAKNTLALPPGDDQKRPPRSIQATVVYDQAEFVESAVNNVRDAILIGGLFSILILLAFLRSWRATLISALAIPTTLAMTFLFLHWSGETLNLMSLGGLAVAIGLIIDDTVVVIENIARHLSSDRRPRAAGEAHAGHAAPLPNGSEAAVATSIDSVAAASSEITGAVFGSTMTTVLVFVPLAFIVGVYGQFFAALSWSLSIAVLVSMVISLTVVPVFAARFLAGRPMPEPGPIYRFFANIYEHMLSAALRVPRLVLFLSVAAMALGVVLVTGLADIRPEGMRPPREPNKPPVPLFKGLETGLMPNMDEGAFVLDYWAPAGTPLAETEAMTSEIEKILLENPDVDAYVRRTGAELGLFATQTSRGDFQVVLRRAAEDPISLLSKPVRPPMDDLEKELKANGKKFDKDGKEWVRAKYRRRPLTKVMEEVEDKVKDTYAEHQLKFETVQIMADELSDLSGANKPIEVKLMGPDHRELRRIADGLGETLEKKGKGRGIKGVNSNVQAGNPDLLIAVDTGRAERLGLESEAVERQLRAMFEGIIATEVPESSTRITGVRVRYPDEIRFGPEEKKVSGIKLRHFDPRSILRQWILLPEHNAAPHALTGPLSGPTRAVPLSALADIRMKRTPDVHFRDNQQPAIFVTTELNEEEAGLGSVVTDIKDWMSQLSLPAGYHWEMGGHYIQQQGAFRSLLVVMIVAILLVFIMLAFQFRSVVLPLLIFLTQPLSLVSGLFALWITNTPLNVSSYMGAILLIGLDMKNGILLVEYIQQLRHEGMELRPALLLAGRTRFRPILMTSMAAILGLFPLALGIGPGAQMQQPLAIMVIGGLTANMLFTRLVIPVGYLVIEGEHRKPEAQAVVKPVVAAPLVTTPS